MMVEAGHELHWWLSIPEVSRLVLMLAMVVLHISMWHDVVMWQCGFFTYTAGSNVWLRLYQLQELCIGNNAWSLTDIWFNPKSSHIDGNIWLQLIFSQQCQCGGNTCRHVANIPTKYLKSTKTMKSSQSFDCLCNKLHNFHIMNNNEDKKKYQTTKFPFYSSPSSSKLRICQ